MASAPCCRGAFPVQSSARSTFVSGSGLQFRAPLHLQATMMRCARPICAVSVSSPEKILSDDEPEEETEFTESLSQLEPSAFEVQSLLMEVCDETSVAELELKVGAFKLHMKRDLGKIKVTAPVVPTAPPVPSKPMVESVSPVVAPSPPKSSSVSSATLLATPASKSGSRFGLLDAATDEGLLFVTSPKVGLFRRSRVVKGKSGRPLCEEGQFVKKNQVVCYVEQLGTQQPVEAENSGEVAKVLWEDGEAVGYGDPLVAIRPSFPGIQ